MTKRSTNNSQKIQRLIFALVILLIAICPHKSFAQSNGELSAAISGGQGSINDFFSNYAGSSALGNLDPNLLNQALSPANGGLSNLTDNLSDTQIGGLINGVVENGGTAGAGLGTALIGDIADQLPTSAASGILENVTAGTLGQIESVLPGSLTNLTDAIPNLDNLFSDVVGDQLGGFLDFAGGAGGSFELGGFGFTNNGDGSVTITIPGLGSITLGGGLGSIFGGGGSRPTVGGPLPSGGTGITEDTALPSSVPMSEMCDPNIINAMNVQAWLEAQREVTNNANIIAKPDSVLEYSCFDQYLNVLAYNARYMFSENFEFAWINPNSITSATNSDGISIGIGTGGVDVGPGGGGGGVVVGPDGITITLGGGTSVDTDPSAGLIQATDMDQALTELVANHIQTFVQNNFQYSFLGERGSIDYTPITPIPGTEDPYTCNQMDLVWQEAKCMNFAQRPEDGFLTFVQHSSNEIRNLGGTCSGSPRYATFIPAATASAWRAEYDTNIETVAELLRTYTTVPDSGEGTPEDCGETSRTFMSGMTLFTDGDDIAETICINPGCYYDGDECVPM